MSQTPHPALVQHLRNAQRILIFSGAGISTNSGIPDYRGPAGIWKTRQPVYYQDFMSSESARVQYWTYRSSDWARFRDAEPNDAHRAIVELERAGKLVMVVTQNVDGLHRKAGTSGERLVELHGSNREVECQSCLERSDPQAHVAAFTDTGMPPQCHCGGWLKMATISFGQSLRPDDLERASAVTRIADLVIAMGSTLSVYPAASVPLMAAQRGAKYIIINVGATEHDRLPGVTLRLEGDVSELFVPAVREALATQA